MPSKDYDGTLSDLRSNNVNRIPLRNGRRTLILACNVADSHPRWSVNEIEAFMDAVQGNVHLKDVVFGSSRLLDLFSFFLDNVLPGYRCIEGLIVTGFRITDDHLTALIAAMKTNTSLKRLYINSRCSVPGWAKKLVDELAATNTLKRFKLLIDPSQRDDDLLRAIAQWIANENCSLEILDIQRSKLTDSEVEILADGLKENKSLIHLNLDSNNITNYGCWVIARALQPNTSIAGLSLSGNQITDAGASALEGTLKNVCHTVMRNVYMSDNARVSDGQLQRINDLCRINQRLSQYCHQYYENVRTVPSNLLPHVLGTVSAKPDLIYKMLKYKAEAIPEPNRLDPRNEIVRLRNLLADEQDAHKHTKEELRKAKRRRVE